jgi:hypothetical protein
MNKIIKGRTSFCTETIELKLKLETDFLELGRRLIEIKMKRLYEGGWDSWSDFLDDMKIDDGVASKLMKIYGVFVNGCGFSPARIAKAGGWSRISEVLPLIKTYEDARRLFDMVTVMRNRTDIRRTVHEERTGTSMMTCQHRNTYTLIICRDCGVRLREFSEDIKITDTNHEKYKQLVA